MYLPLRASDSDRLRAIGVLKKGYVSGRLSTQTFEQRVGVAQATRSRATLRTLVADLTVRWFAAQAVWGDAGSAPGWVPVWTTLLLSRCARTTLLIGRSPSCDIVFGDSSVSRHHASFHRRGANWYVIDLDSTNGTYVEDVRVQRAEVNVGCRVRLGGAFIDIE